VALLADTIAGGTGQSDWIDNVRFTGMLDVGLTGAMASLASDGVEGLRSEALSIGIVETGGTCVTEYAFLRNRTIEFHDILGDVAWRKVPAKTVEPGERRLE